ncbi:MAG TPA: hypothetical protein ENI97_01715 [Gammaproteobacteria bacterium]|nr:hypothetical protein [Gammaproteobacteria bacterium]
MKPLHICITTVLFDRKPEGICTGRLIRALLQRGHRVTVLTSSKEGSSLHHPRLKKIVFSHRPRYPRALFKLMAGIEGGVFSNFYLWAKRAAGHDFAQDIPDVFYGRAWPHASMVPAYQLARKYRRPLLLHFSDPFPAPNEDVSFDGPFFRNLQKMVDVAGAITFTNSETIAYQQRHLNFDSAKAHVLNHISPDPVMFDGAGQQGHFYHVGWVGPSRSPVPLLEGFALHVMDHPASRLYFVGANPKHVVPEIDARGLSEVVKVLPFTDDVQTVFEKAGILVSIDTEATPAIFTPTKIVEYMVTSRPILAVTPQDSPVSRLLRRAPDTAVAVSDYAAEAVAAGMAQVLQLEWSGEVYEKRLAAMAEFGAMSVAAAFEEMVDALMLKGARPATDDRG